MTRGRRASCTRKCKIEAGMLRLAIHRFSAEIATTPNVQTHKIVAIHRPGDIKVDRSRRGGEVRLAGWNGKRALVETKM